MIVSDQVFEAGRHTSLEPVTVRIVSEAPRQRLITFRHFYTDDDGVEVEYKNYLVCIPWVHYQWDYRPDVAPEHPWLLTYMFFSPVSINESLQASAPCLPNFYNCSPCTGEDLPRAQTDIHDPNFIHGFWSEIFNYDGDLFNGKKGNIVWQTLKEKSTYQGREDHVECIGNFDAWEKLNQQDVLELPWPQDIVVPV